MKILAVLEISYCFCDWLIDIFEGWAREQAEVDPKGERGLTEGYCWCKFF